MNRLTIDIDGRRREYLFHDPGRSSAALVVYLHGMGAAAWLSDQETGWTVIARQLGFAVAIPEGLRSDLNLPPHFSTNSQMWNDDSPTALENGGIADDVGLIAWMIDRSVETARIDRRRVCVTGFSNGAGMCFSVATELAEHIAAIAPVAGHCWIAEPKPARPVPTLHVIGSDDPLVPIHGAAVRSLWQRRLVNRPAVVESLERWAKAIACEPVPVDPTVTGNLRVDTYPGKVPFKAVTISGLGHHRPGGKGLLSTRIAGPPTDAVNGTALIWDFFKELTL